MTIILNDGSAWIGLAGFVLALILAVIGALVFRVKDLGERVEALESDDEEEEDDGDGWKKKN